MSKNTSSIAITIIKGILALQVIGVIWLLFFSDIIQDNQPSVRTTSTITINNNSDNLDDIKNQLELEKKRVAKMIQAQQKNSTQNELRSAKTASTRKAEIEAIKAQNQALRQQLKEVSASTRDLLAELKQNSNANISAEDKSFLEALEMIPGNASDLTTAPPAVPNNNSEAINRIVVADSDKPGHSIDSISSRVRDLMKTGDKVSKDPKSNTNLVVAKKGTPKTGAIEKLNSLQSRIDNLLAQSTGSIANTAPSTDNTAYLKSLAPLEKERKNETRWVTVVKGDTLFLIAERAYQDGNLYPKIFQANPQVLTNPDLITVGQRLRVPL